MRAFNSSLNKVITKHQWVSYKKHDQINPYNI